MRRMIYINLDEALARRAAIEEHMRSACVANDLALVRLAATPASEFADIKGAHISSAARACWRSHERAIEMCGEALRPSHVVEDDVYASATSLAYVDELIRQLPEEGWDLLFCDVCIPHPADMVNWYGNRQALLRERPISLVNLKGVRFAGMASYVVNPNSVGKILAALKHMEPKSIPIDIAVLNLVNTGTLNAFVALPFVTTLSPLSSQSQIQVGAPMTEMAWDAFRRLMWIEADAERVLSDIRATVPVDFVDARAAAMGELIKIAASEKFIAK